MSKTGFFRQNLMSYAQLLLNQDPGGTKQVAADGTGSWSG